MSRDFYKNEITDEREENISYSEKKEKQEMGKIKGKISVSEVMDKNKIFIFIGIVAFLLLVIILFSSGKKIKKEESYTLGNQNEIKVEAEKKETGNESDKLTEEEEKVLEDLAKKNSEKKIEDKEDTIVENPSRDDQYYKNDELYKNSGGFSNIENLSNEDTEIIEEKKAKDRKKRDISFVKSGSSGISSNSTEGLSAEISQHSGKEKIVDTDQNRQESKREFIEKKRTGSFYSNNFVTPSFSKYELKTGTLIPGILVTEINSDLPGNILGQVTSNVYSTNGKVLIPMGTKIIGKYDSSLSYGQNRVLIVWERLVFPNKSTLELDNFQGTDLLGRAGMTGKVNYHGWKLLRSVILSSLLGATTSGLGSIQLKADNKGNRSVSIGGTAAEEAKDSLNQAVSSLIEKDLNRQPTVKIKQGSRFTIFVSKDIIIEPYKKSR